ncbi:response regulator transcription factor [Hydrogenimonas thermophila]|uniref:DNA-binding response regulator, OmpR family, contains REC and winged-helix (WHTH) domain n=1 Tax=Hydrogenimonas thermophila TaxID=223786 RepID=A0A1I5MDC3_9BACT|nr:response regulator transcription factor [Hydrogenimonas thermophila]WOE70659.1 response regulator transcription factor [Hydrogenimonas thermophila]WOE73177.1 response regulator transcription factor [Hydrogenimonas thermophila]SFP07530.1 DNA-binding response regulator, OmpR family, contains REC and winged-helix (wHTH) domain [Hydrogenimonas thermophila]
MSHKSKIFLLEDDTNLSDTITEFLEDEGFEVDTVFDSEEAEEKLYENNYDLLLLDVNIPGKNGFEILKEARKQGIDTPAIFITSLNSIENLEEGYESGADDYIRKPFALKELLLRITTLLKRSFSHKNSQLIKISQNIEYDTISNTLYMNGKPVSLQPKELLLLKLFLSHPNEVIAHETIYDRLWGYDEIPSESALRTYIKNLRKVIGKEKIVSIKRYGYKYLPE